MAEFGQDRTLIEQVSSERDRNDKERSNLTKARYMALDRYPVTDLADDLCRIVGDYLIRSDRGRKNGRGKEALDPSTEPYEAHGVPRHLVGQWVVMTLYHGTYQRSWPKSFKDKFLKQTGNELQEVHPLRMVRNEVLTRHPVIAKSQHHRSNIFDLIYPEAETIMRAMLQLKRAYGIPSLTVHDSVIVREREISAAAEAVTRSFKSVCGVEPKFGNWERAAGVSA